MRFIAAALTCATLIACSPQTPEKAPEAAPAPAASAAPAESSCPDDGPRLPLSGVCQVRAYAYMEPDSAEPDAPAGCEWGVRETQFADQVLLYRALTCGDKTTTLDYAGGAHAAELSYITSALHPEAVPQLDKNGADEVKPIVRVATYETDDDFRLKETIGSNANIAQCEIRSAGAGYPASAKVIAPKTPGADCGLYALSGKTDNFWIVRKDWVYAFMLPKGPHDLDPATLTILPAK